MTTAIPIETPKYTLTRSIMPVGDIHFATENNKSVFIYKPKDDITGIELARLLHLFVIAAGVRNYGLSWQEFMEEHQLWRHFEEKVN